MELLIVLGIIFGVLAAFCCLPIKIRIYLIQDGFNVHGKIVFSLLGFLNYTLKIPHISPKRKSYGLPPLGRILPFVKIFLEINFWLFEHIKFNRFIWKTKLGFGDAAATGIGGGILWGIKGFIFSLLQKNYSQNCRTEISVIPVFDGERISTEFDCIFNLPIGYIIIASMRLLLLWITFNLSSKGAKLRERPSD